MNTQTFIEKANIVHNNKYDYSLVEYNGCKTPVKIICPIHGEFLQKPYLHLSGRGCQLCGKERQRDSATYTIEDIKTKSNEIYGDKYEILGRDKENVYFLCKKHGTQKKNLFHFMQGSGCEECGKESRSIKQRTSKEEFIEKAKNIHGDKYDYSESEYINNKTPIKIKCEKHGYFMLRPDMHTIQKQGCPECAMERRKEKIKNTLDYFISKAREAHGNKYDYSKVNYINNKTRVCIICPEHGEFYQTPTKHTDSKHGCPYCSESKYEEEISQMLTKNNIGFEKEKLFEWLGKKRYDFYVPSKNVLIECQGMQHFIPNDFFGGVDMFNAQVESDNIKHKKSLEQGMKIYYYVPNFNEIDTSLLKSNIYTKENVITNKENLRIILLNN